MHNIKDALLSKETSTEEMDNRTQVGTQKCGGELQGQGPEVGE